MHGLLGVADLFVEACRAAGLDLVVPFDVARYNAGAPPEQALPAFAEPASLAFLVGNTRALWDTLRIALRSDPTREALPDPLDAYVMREVEHARAQLPATTRVLYAHTLTPAPVPIQRVAQAIGFAVIAPSHLSVHPSYGPWFALRAVVLVDMPAPALACAPAANPCLRCAKPCVAALDEALAAASARGVPLGEAVAADFRRWANVREVCPEGRAFRYPDDQIEYHYAKNRQRLKTV